MSVVNELASLEVMLYKNYKCVEISLLVGKLFQKHGVSNFSDLYDVATEETNSLYQEALNLYTAISSTTKMRRGGGRVRNH